MPLPPSSRRSLLLLGLSIMLIAFNLRTPVTSLGPVLPDAMAGAQLSAAAASLLTTIPSLCFGFFSPLAPWLSRNFGLERAILVGLAALTLGTALRLGGTAACLFAGQILSCGGIGFINVLLPSLVKRDFPRRVASVTGFYVTSMALGSALSAGVTVPLEHAFGSWAMALAFWALPVLLAAAAWGPRSVQAVDKGDAGPPGRLRGLWTDRIAWQVTLFMGLQSALAYIVLGWLAPMLRDRGLAPAEAGLALSLSIMAQCAASLSAPAIASFGRDQRLAAAFLSLLCVASLLACLFAPLSLVWPAVILLGFSQGGLFPLALMLIVLRSPDSNLTRHLSSMAQGVGYIIASVGPLLAGLLHAWMHNWLGMAALVVVIGGIMLAAGLGAGRARHIRASYEA